MTNILFVDDDAIARRSIVSRDFWKNYDWNLIYVAKDAIDTLEFIKKEKPDIIICDIQMPVMDGIQMAVIAKNYYPEIKFIFLSGYKEFEYAQQALKLNAVDYLTKPIDDQELIQVIQSAETLFQKERESELILNEKYPIIKRKYLSKLMFENFKEMDESVFKAFDINLSNGLGIVGFIEFSNAELSNAELSALCNNLSSLYAGCFFISMEYNQIFLIFTCNNISDSTTFYQHLAHMENAVEVYCHEHDFLNPFIFHYGSIISNLNNLYDSYQKLLYDTSSETYRLLQEVKKYLNTHFPDCDLTLTQIASHFNVNHCYLTSIFKEQFGVNLYDYLIQLRMKRAGELAKSSCKKVYEIAEAVGYKNSQYFSISFRKYYNCTISQYKNT